MSTTIAKNYQVGSDGTATNNFTIRQPATPDGTVRIANGNSGTTTDLVTVTSAGNVGVGTSSPLQQLHLSSASATGVQITYQGVGASRIGVAAGNLLTFGLDTSNGTTTRMTIDSSGNLGLGVTPSAWISSGKAIDIGGFGSVAQTSSGSLASTFNAYQNSAGNWIYKTTNAAAQYQCGLAGLGQHAWFVAPSGTAGNAISFTQAMTLDASGNLGVGTTSPGARLHVAGEQLIQPTTAANAKLSMRHGSIGNNNYFEVDSSSNTIFGTNNTERARITSGGNFGLGTTNPVYRMQVQANATTYAAVFQNQNASPYGLYINHNGASPNNAGNEFIICWDTTATRFRVNSNGGIENYQANNVNLSDRREKTNFAPAGDYLSKICAIPVQTFNYIDQNMEEDPGLTLGVVAQDVQAVAPELVSESNLGTKEDPKMRLSIYQTDLQYALMKCIQELKAELDSVKTELALLKGTV